MATDTLEPDSHAFYAYLGERLKRGQDSLTPEQLVKEFRSHQSQVQHLREKLDRAHEQYLLGQAAELDAEALIDEVTKQLADEGITE